MCLNGGDLNICTLPACNKSFCDKCVKVPPNITAEMDNIEFHCPGCHVDSEYKRKTSIPTEQYEPAVYNVSSSSSRVSI